jgi:cold shock CspA family protein
MTHFGTVESFDETQGRGLIKPEIAGSSIRFEKSDFTWDNKSSPPVGKRLSYELSELNGETRAVNLKNA